MVPYREYKKVQPNWLCKNTRRSFQVSLKENGNVINIKTQNQNEADIFEIRNEEAGPIKFDTRRTY